MDTSFSFSTVAEVLKYSFMLPVLLDNLCHFCPVANLQYVLLFNVDPSAGNLSLMMLFTF
jgi:hypothetical protein